MGYRDTLDTLDTLFGFLHFFAFFRYVISPMTFWTPLSMSFVLFNQKFNQFCIWQILRTICRFFPFQQRFSGEMLMIVFIPRQSIVFIQIFNAELGVRISLV